MGTQIHTNYRISHMCLNVVYVVCSTQVTTMQMYVSMEA